MKSLTLRPGLIIKEPMIAINFEPLKDQLIRVQQIAKKIYKKTVFSHFHTVLSAPVE